MAFKPTKTQQQAIFSQGATLVSAAAGSGKTAVALLAAYWTIQNGYQAAMMAPTEVLARQHAASFRDLLEPAGITVVLLTGSLTAK